MNIAKTCIQNRVTTILATIMIVVFGLLFTTQLQMALMPNMEMPMAVVMTTYVGASPGDVEELVTDPLEAAIVSVSGIEEIQSSSAENVSTIMITYEEDTDVDIAATKLREKFDMVSLPDDVSDPVIINMNMSEMMPTAMIALSGDDLIQLEALANDLVAPALERIEGVAKVGVYGGLEQQIAVDIDPGRAAGLGLSNSYIAQNLAGQNLLYPGGDIQNGKQTLTVTTDAKFKSLEDVANTLIALPTGGVVRLSEVADVYMETLDPSAIAKVDGKAAVLLQVSKQSGTNEMEVATEVEECLAELKEENPFISYTIPYSARDYISKSVNSAFSNIVQGVLLAAIVVFLFLRRGAATMTICVSMPVCILAVFVMMKVFNLTLNMMSLGGIAMGVGMIVDNSIVVLENINRFAYEGHDRMSACVDGTKEVTSSVVASTLTTLAVFVPMGLAGGMAGMMFKDFALTIATLIAASLVISLTLVPLLCYFTLDEERVRRHQERIAGKKPNAFMARVGGWISKLNDLYMRLLRHFVYHLKTGMLVSIGLVVIFALTLVNTKMVMTPEMDQGNVTISISMPTGSEVEESAAIADRVAAIVMQECPEMEEMYYLVSGGSGGMSMGSGDISMGVTLVNKSERDRSAFEVEDDLREALQDIAGCEISVSAASSMGMGGSGGDIKLKISGDDLEVLELIANDLTAKIAALPDAVDVENSFKEKVPQVKISMNREAAAQYGLAAATVGAAVRAELNGAEATHVTINSQEFTVMVKGDGSAAESLDALRSMPLATPYGGTVPLASVASVTVEQAPMSISRVDQNRQATVTGDTISGDSAAITKEINAILADYVVPQGYVVSTAGSYEDMIENFADLGLVLAVALLLVYFVLAVQFNSFAMPVIVMMILPVAFTGALFALPLTGHDLSMLALVAIIMLAGTVVNNSIVLVEYIKIRRAMGESRQEAILKACPLRIRPIMMTTLTTVLAMVPMALGIGETNEMMVDMGITMISGMVISTIITLVFTPVYYSVIDDLSHKRRRKGKKGAAEAKSAEPALQEAAPAKEKKSLRGLLRSKKTAAAKETAPETAESPEEQAAPADTEENH